MKTVTIVLFSMMWFSTGVAQNHNPKYDKALADSFESDAWGIFILNVSSLDEARALLETDPAIQEKP